MDTFRNTRYFPIQSFGSTTSTPNSSNNVPPYEEDEEGDEDYSRSVNKNPRYNERTNKESWDSPLSPPDERKEKGNVAPYHAPGKKPDRDEENTPSRPSGNFAHNDNYGEKPGSTLKNREGAEQNSVSGNSLQENSLRENRGRPNHDNGVRQRKDRGHYDDREY